MARSKSGSQEEPRDDFDEPLASVTAHVPHPQPFEPKPCPHCGYCPTCGRHTHTHPPYNPYPYYPYTMTYTSTSAAPGSITYTSAY